jgi:acyl carrier protein
MMNEKILTIIADILEIEIKDIKIDDSFRDDLGADSVDMPEIIMKIEVVFNLEISDEASEKFITVQNLLDYVAQSEQNSSL